ncbi:hypothetical protein ACTDI4_03090 [Mesorhizobium sp. PUT5]|uniref:hypothetical protein n=1 Tax=Mesorhizobium sp. PUT5 TaxID=3454629 RepID=UPI003FA4A595
MHASILVIALGTALAATGAARAQASAGKTLESTIIGADVRQEEATAAEKQNKVLAAIDKTADNLGAVRKTTWADRVDIVFLRDAAREEGRGLPSKIEDRVKEHEGEIARLQQEIEANALLFHAIDSRRVLPQDVLAVDFEPAGRVVIYAAARPPQ